MKYTEHWYWWEDPQYEQYAPKLPTFIAAGTPMTKRWYYKQVIHRLGGPAIEVLDNSNGDEYYLFGTNLDEQIYWNELSKGPMYVLLKYYRKKM